MERYIEYYNRNKQLDAVYLEKYANEVKDYYEKNCLGLVVELCELANESKCFKYWSVKKPNKELVLEEYADCLSMLLCIFNYHEVEDLAMLDIKLDNDLVYMFNDVVRMCTLLMDKDNVNDILLKEIFTKLIHISKLLELSEDEILDACYKKVNKNEERLSSDY